MKTSNKTRTIGVVAFSLTSFLSGACADSGISKLNRYDEKKPAVAGFDGFASADLAKLGGELEKKTGVPVNVEPLFHWEHNVEYMKKAEKQKREIILVGYSAGCDQARRAAKKYGKPIERMIVIDYTYTNDHDLDIPANVKHIDSYFSSAKFDLRGWARGDIGKFREAARKDQRFSNPKIIRGAHVGCVNWENLGEDLRKYISESQNKQK